MKQVNFPVGGGSSGYTYSYANCSGTPTTEFVFDDPSVSSWLTLTKTSDRLTIAASAAPSTQTSPRTARVNIRVNGTTCSEYFSISQAGTDCHCEDMKFTPSVSWSPDDSGSTSQVNVVTQAASCVDCNSITYNSLQHFTVQKSGCNINVYPSGKNTTRTAYTETLTISYTAGASSCSSSITLTQLGEDCSCESIKSRIELYNYGDPNPVTIPTGVVTASTSVICPLNSKFVLAKADVQDCGVVHVSSTDTSFFNGGVQFDSATSEVYCNGILNQGYTSGAYFINTKSAEKECTQITVTVRCGDSCTCLDVSSLHVNSSLSSVPCDMDGNDYLFDPWYTPSCLMIKALQTSSLPDWISVWENSFWVCPNTGGSRSTDVYYEVVHRTNSTTCVTSSVTITQLGSCPNCTCANMPLAKRKYDEVIQLSNRGGTERLWFTPDGDIPYTCQFETDSCTTSQSERVTIIPRISYYNLPGGREWITGTTTGRSYDDYYIDIYYEGTNENRLANLYADFAIDGRKCSDSTDSYALSQEVEDTCACESAVTWFDGSTDPIKEVSYSTTSVTWTFNRSYYCPAYALRVTGGSSCSQFPINVTTGDTAITATFSENTGSTMRQCSFISVAVVRRPDMSTSAICGTYTLGVKQLPCGCDNYDLGYNSENGFSDCKYNYGYDEEAWYGDNYGTSRTIARINKPSATCVSVTCEVSSSDDPSLQYFDAYTGQGYGNTLEVVGQVKNAGSTPSANKMTYTISYVIKTGTTTCNTITKSFTLWRECPCGSANCTGYNMSSHVSTASTSVTTSDGTIIATISSFPTDSCLEVRAEVQDSNNHAEIRGNNVVAWGYRHDDAFTVYVRLYYYSTVTDTWNLCTGGEVALPLHVI